MDIKYMFHRAVYRLMRWPMYLAAKLKYNYSYETAPDIKTPYIVLANHTTGWDHFLVGMSFKKHMYFLASEHSFRMGLQSFLMKTLAAPISRVKGSADGAAVLGILRRLKKGYNICFFPEGERSFDGRTGNITAAAAKLIKLAGVPVITFRLIGGYLSDPRWGRNIRKGKMRGVVAGVHQPEEFSGMSIGEIHDLVAGELYEDAFDTQRREMISYKGDKLAEGLQESLFICPCCKGTGTARGAGNVFSCSCGMKAELDETGFFREGAPMSTIAEWYDMQIEIIRQKCDAGRLIFSDPSAVLFSLGAGHETSRISEGTVTLTPDELTIGDCSFKLSHMSTPSTCRGKTHETLMFAAAGAFYELDINGDGSRRKYVLAIEALKKKQEICVSAV